MDLDVGIQALLSWQFILFAIAVSVLVYMAKTVIETAKPTIVNSKWYSNVGLPLTPPLLGATIALLASKYAYPNGMTALSERVLFGIVAGAMSGLVYRVVRGAIVQKITSQITTVQTVATTVFPDPVVQEQTVVIPVPPLPPAPLPPAIP